MDVNAAAALFNSKAHRGYKDWRVDWICILGNPAPFICSDKARINFHALEWRAIADALAKLPEGLKSSYGRTARRG